MKNNAEALGNNRVLGVNETMIHNFIFPLWSELPLH